jgi:hypothetical protein
MFKILLVIVTTGTLAVTAQAEHLKKGSFYAYSKQDMEVVIKTCVRHPDATGDAMLEQFTRDGVISLPMTAPMEVIVMSGGSLTGFVFPGKTKILWTPMENIEY